MCILSHFPKSSLQTNFKEILVCTFKIGRYFEKLIVSEWPLETVFSIGLFVKSQLMVSNMQLSK